jgi:hypothetical protein
VLWDGRFHGSPWITMDHHGAPWSQFVKNPMICSHDICNDIEKLHLYNSSFGSWLKLHVFYPPFLILKSKCIPSGLINNPMRFSPCCACNFRRPHHKCLPAGRRAFGQTFRRLAYVLLGTFQVMEVSEVMGVSQIILLKPRLGVPP